MSISCGAYKHILLDIYSFSLYIYIIDIDIYFKFNNVLLYNYAGVIEFNINQLTGSYRSIFT